MGEASEASAGEHGWTAALKALGKYLIAGVVFVFVVTLLVEAAVPMIPDHWERKLAGQFGGGETEDRTGDVDASSGKGEGEGRWGGLGLVQRRADEGDRDRVRKVQEKLMEGGKWRDIDYRIVVGEWGMGPNAFATLGGTITVTPEMLDILQTEEGLAFVIAHEIGHHERRHVLKGNARNLVIGLAFLAVGAGSGEGSATGIAALPVLSGDRAMEEEADAFAVDLVFEKYGVTDNVDEFFLWASHHDPESKWMTWASTHPHPERRLELLRERIKNIKREQ